MALTLDDPLVTSDDALFRELETEAVLLNVRTGIYYGLNPVGTRAWQLLSAHTRIAGVVDIMLDEFDVERDVLERDLLALAGQWLDSGLCRRGEPGGS